MYVDLCFWNGGNNEEGQFKTIDCFIDSTLVDKLLSRQPP